MKISVHLSFAGQAADAFADYARIFNGTIVFQMKYRESPMAAQVPADWQDKLYHATMTIGGLTLMAGDHHNTVPEEPQGFMLTVHPSTPDDARRVFDALAEGGTVKMPIQKTFWSAAFGVVTDRFGIPWSINCEVAPEAA